MSSQSIRNRTAPSDTDTSAHLPPPRKEPALQDVDAPLSSTRLPRLIYLLLVLSSLLGAFYTYRVIQWKSDAGGWFNFALGRRPPQLTDQRPPSHDAGNVEDRIHALAEALGMPSRDLAAAIAVAVKEYVPPASLSSVAARETGVIVDELVKGGGAKSGQAPPGVHAAAEPASSAGSILGGVVAGMEGFVGMDEP